MSFETTSSQQAIAAPPDSETEVTATTRRTVPTSLDYVFDDPDEGEPGRDRMLVHGLWETALVVALAGAAYLLYQKQAAALSGTGLRELLASAAVIGVLAMASALSLRAAAPNLAVGAVAVAAGLYFGADSGGGLLQPLLIVIGICALIGVVHGLVIVGPHVPAWAVSLGVAMALFAWSSRQSAVDLTSGYDPAPHAYYWFGGFALLSIGASLVGLVPTLRRFFGRFRPVADPAQRRGWTAALITVVATGGSTVLAGVAGVLLVTSSRAAAPSDGIDLTALAIGAALLGGTSAYGRRGGLFGTVLAAALLAVVAKYGEQSGWTAPLALLGALAIAVGLLVTRTVERFGRPRPGKTEDDNDDWIPKVHSASDNRSWSSPATTGTGGLWASDDAWGTSDRR